MSLKLGILLETGDFEDDCQFEVANVLKTWDFEDEDVNVV
jgi:hypothetical protein